MHGNRRKGVSMNYCINHRDIFVACTFVAHSSSDQEAVLRLFLVGRVQC